MVIRQTEPTIIRDSSGAVNSVESSPDAATVAAAAGAGSGRPWAASFSIDCISASASAVRPTASSQRGDSGRLLRRYQTISAPIPPMTNIARQPNSGTTREATSSDTGNPVTTHTAIMPSHMPRVRAGTNSVMVEYPTTLSAPNPKPMMKRHAISTIMFGANAAANDASPNTSKL